MKPIILLPFLTALALSPGLAAQALPQAPPPPPTETEQQLAQITSVPQLERIAAAYGQKQDWRRQAYALQRLAQLRPQNGHYKYALSAAYALQDMKREAYDGLVRLQASGYAFDAGSDPRFAKIHGTKVWDYIVANLQANAVEFGEGQVAMELPAGDYLFEALAWDPKRGQLLAGSAREGKIWLVGKKGALADFIVPDEANRLWAVLDMAVDARRDTLWVATSAIAHAKTAKADEYGRAAVLAFTLSSGKLKARYEVPADGREHILNGIVVGPRGNVFASDGINRQIFKVEAGQLTKVVENPQLTTLRGMAISGDGSTLYFADFELGLFGIDLAAGKAFEVTQPESLTTFGIEGLAWYDGTLVAIQSAFPPKRVMRLHLDESGRRIERAQPLEAGRAAFGTPTRGVVAGDEFLFIANNQKARYDRLGNPKPGATFEPVRVFATNLRFAWETQGGGQLRPAAPRPDEGG